LVKNCIKIKHGAHHSPETGKEKKAELMWLREEKKRS